MTNAAAFPYLVDESGTEHHLNSEQAVFGRAIDCDIVLTTKLASRQHARIHRENWRWFIEDLNSTNGTLLNSERLLPAQRTELRDGDILSIGGIALTFHGPDNTTRESPFPSLEVDFEGGSARLDRQPLALSPKEFTLLGYLYQRRGQVCTKEEIGQAVWSEYQSEVYEYQIENLIRRLRTKIERDPNAPLMLLTVRGQGYKLLAHREA